MFDPDGAVLGIILKDQFKVSRAVESETASRNLWTLLTWINLSAMLDWQIEARQYFLKKCALIIRNSLQVASCPCHFQHKNLRVTLFSFFQILSCWTKCSQISWVDLSLAWSLVLLVQIHLNSNLPIFLVMFLVVTFFYEPPYCSLIITFQTLHYIDLANSSSEVRLTSTPCSLMAGELGFLLDKFDWHYLSYFVCNQRSRSQCSENPLLKHSTLQMLSQVVSQWLVCALSISRHSVCWTCCYMLKSFKDLSLLSSKLVQANSALNCRVEAQKKLRFNSGLPAGQSACISKLQQFGVEFWVWLI